MYQVIYKYWFYLSFNCKNKVQRWTVLCRLLQFWYCVHMAKFWKFTKCFFLVFCFFFSKLVSHLVWFWKTVSCKVLSFLFKKKEASHCEFWTWYRRLDSCKFVQYYETAYISMYTYLKYTCNYNLFPCIFLLTF